MRASKSGAVLATPVTVLPLVSILRALVASGEYGVESVAGQFDRQGAVPRRASSRTTGVHMNDVAPAPEISTGSQPVWAAPGTTAPDRRPGTP
jgi:hypothetical protein